MVRTPEDVLNLLAERKKPLEVPFSRMRLVRDLYNSEIAIPLPEINKNEMPAVANLAQQGLDQYGQRIGSTLPDIFFPPEKPGVDKHETAARNRRQVALGWWAKNRMNLKMRRRARWYVGYGSAPVMISWDPKTKMPRWDPQDPLGTYPAPTIDPDDVWPDDCIFTFQWTAARLKREYPEQFSRLRKGPNVSPDSRFDIVRYVDAEQIMLLCQGAKGEPYHTYTNDGTHANVVLENIPNRAGVPLGVTPGRITLDRPMGQFDGMVGMYLEEAEFNALTRIAARKAIFPDLWLVDGPNSVAKIVKVADGMTGEVGRVTGGQLVPIQPQAGYLTMPVQDRLRESQRLTAGIVPDLTGEAGTNVRTGRRASQLLSAVVDFPVQEAQDVFAAAMECELKAAVALDRAYSSGKKSIHVAWKGANGRIDYEPKDLWSDSELSVSYAFAGTDTNGLVIEAGQRLGMKTLSRRSFMEVDPLISDAEVEQDRIDAERIRDASFAAFEQWAADPSTDPELALRAAELVESGKMTPAAAWVKVKEEAQKAQAAVVPAAAPEAQPGMMGPMGPSIEGPTDDMGNLNSLLMSLRGPQMTSPAEEMSETG